MKSIKINTINRIVSLRFKVAIILTAIIASSGCKKFVEINTPVTQVATNSVFENDQSAVQTLLGLYISFKNTPALMEKQTAIASDELTYYGSDAPNFQIYTNSLDLVNQPNWNVYFNYIYQANAIIENSQASKNLSAAIKQQITGEALFLRSYTYFNLVNLYGDIPLIATTDYTKNAAIARTSKDQVYAQLISDLKTAKILLSPEYLDANNSKTTDRVRATSWAASALLARIYLYTGKYQEAEAESSLIIANTAKYSLPTDPNDVFKANSSEAILQFFPGNSSDVTAEATGFLLTNAPGGGNTTISTGLLNSFESNDKRRNAWIGSITVGANTYYYPFKYKYRVSPGSLLEYSMILRLAEQYLIRADARVNQKKLTGGGSAVEDLNIIRNRAGIGNYSGATDQNSIMTAIAQERRVELFTENDRWFDLKRTGKIDAVMSVANPLKGGGGWKPYQALWPIPKQDLTNDLNLTQNVGY